MSDTYTKPKFKMFDTVASVKDPDVPVGIILGMTYGRLYLKIFKREYPQWDADYPDWTEKCVMVVLLFKERPHMSFDQYLSYYERSFEEEIVGGGRKERLSEEELKVAYRASVTYVKTIATPEDDLVECPDDKN